MASIWDTLFPNQDYRTAAPSGGYADLYANSLLGNRTDTPTSVGAMETGKDFIPVLSDVLAFGEAGHALSEGDRKTAAILAAGGLLGTIPGLGPTLARPVMAAGRKAADVASRIEVDPNAVGSLLGNVRMKPKSPAEEIADLLSSGRADDVTDEMLGKLTAQDNSELFDLYQSGATGMDLPMDEASRMARAESAGYNVDRGFYRGGGSDRKSFSADAGTFKTQNTGVFMDPNPMRAETYAKQGGGVVAPLLSRSDAPIVFGDMSEWNKLEAPSYAYDPVSDVDIPLIEQGVTTTTDDIARAARQRNLAAIEIQDVMDPGPMRWRNEDKSIREYPQFGTTRVEFDPTNIRSRFARFDPRLAHLKNLSASVGAAPIGLLALREEQKRANEDQYKRGLLQ